MVYIDWVYYKTVFEGTLVPSDTFPTMARLASDVVDMIAMLPITQNMLPGADRAALIQKATAYEVDYLYEQGGESAANGAADAFMGSESLGEYRYAGSAQSGDDSAVALVEGIPVSPITKRLLYRAGVMSRWVYEGVTGYGE